MTDPAPRPFGGAPEPEPTSPEPKRSSPLFLLFLVALAAWPIARRLRSRPAAEEPLRWAQSDGRPRQWARPSPVPWEAPAPPASRALPAAAPSAPENPRERRKADYQRLLQSLRGKFRSENPLVGLNRPAATTSAEVLDSNIQVIPQEAEPQRPREGLGVETGPVPTSYPPEIESAWEAIRASGEDGSRLVAFARQERLPIEYARLEPPLKGRYQVEWIHSGDRFVGRDRALILLDESLRGGPAEKLSLALYHEYIHRLQDLSGLDLREPNHTPEAFHQALSFLRAQSQSDPNAPVDVPGPVQATFGLGR